MVVGEDIDEAGGASDLKYHHGYGVPFLIWWKHDVKSMVVKVTWHYHKYMFERHLMLYSWESTIEKFSLSYHETPKCDFALSIAIIFFKKKKKNMMKEKEEEKYSVKLKKKKIPDN